MAAVADNDTKGSVLLHPPDQPGLEVADLNQCDGLEVVPNQGEGAKEVVPGSGPPLERRSSVNQPEAWHLPHQQLQPLIEREKQAAAEEREPEGETEALPSSWTRRRYCGMRGKWLAILLLTTILVLVAAVLGGVLGTVLSHRSDETARDRDLSLSSGTSSSGDSSQAVTGSRKALLQSGIAATLLGNNDNTLLTYYQDDSGRIIENVYTDGAWSHDASSAAAVVANATSGSPLAAISYEYDGNTWRQIFFVADDASLWTTKAPATGAWEEAYRIDIDPLGSTANITSTHFAPGPALAACFGYDQLDGIRLYYGDTSGYIQELGQNFNESTWHAFHRFPQSDSLSGVGCNYYYSVVKTFIDVYYRNTGSLELEQSFLQIGEDVVWTVSSTANGTSIGSGTAISVAAEDSSEYIFFQSSNGTVTRGLIDAVFDGFREFGNVGSAISGSRLASASVGDGTVYLFQNATDDPTIWLSNWDMDRSLVSSQALPGTGEG